MKSSISEIGYALPLTVASIFLLLLILELLFPLRLRKRPFVRRFTVNICLSAIALATGALAVKPVALGLARWTTMQSFGLLHMLRLPTVWHFVIGFLLLDVSFYYWHRANHEFRFLWRFHNVHHGDPDLDVSTSFRFHFAEVLLSTVFRAVQVGLTGVSPMILTAYEVTFQCATMFHHSNVRLPIRAERLLNKFMVTPRMHGIHHSMVKAETNSNYSVIFRWWDSMHRSLRLNVPQSHIDIGVPAYQSTGDNEILPLFAMPFRKQREYWRLTDGTESQREASGLEKSVGFLQE
ncbi:MAG: sterol desaturase family protein [Candidatus Abyssobacteria bacterium SURF_17]|uniref:Sterol desaturase family protein n=1 Tax=Candidatus Abyssobacteria bacterium SURF_17 TaxID=2093361 RepID=A0A419F939_9BACT|nr:MAG: sterol desaturase family protein [Candidatus Abyssubacteria bacterium SURF_17]